MKELEFSNRDNVFGGAPPLLLPNLGHCLTAFSIGYAVGWVASEVTGLPEAVGTAVGEAGAAAGLWGQGTNEPAILPGAPAAAPDNGPPYDNYILGGPPFTGV